MVQHNYQSRLGIKAWAEEDRPREKLLLKGRHNLTDAELLAILLGSGSREETAVGLAQQLLNRVNNNLYELGKCSLNDLKDDIKGIGDAKAITIIAAMELSRRRQLSEIETKPKITSSSDAYRIIAPLLMDLEHEEFWILMLNRGNRVIGRQRISTGGISGTVVDAKMVFKAALLKPASSIILCHNHPSDNLQPSQADKNITKKLKEGGKLIDVAVLDHLIITSGNYMSFADEGLM